MKFLSIGLVQKILGRSREGAWIEISVDVRASSSMRVAPVRERGLKLLSVVLCLTVLSRSREGAWIEMLRARSETSFA